MGSQCSKEYMERQMFKKLTVITLSYCGLTSSPFEFYINQYQHQLERIGDYFQQLMLPKKKEGTKRLDEVKDEEGMPDFLDRDKSRKIFGNIELKFKKRYSPMFDKMAGIIKNEKADSNSKDYRFVTQQQFEKKWEQKFQNQCEKDQSLRKQMDKQQPHLQIRKANVRKYDFLMFRALLRYVYKKEKFEDVVHQNPQNYINIISPLFEFSFLDETSKLSKFQYGFRKTNPDVYFLQQTTNELVQFLEKRAKRNYRWIGDDDGQLIIVKNQTFFGEEFQVVDVDKEFKLQPPKVQSNERFIKPIALGTASKRFLFVSLHFSSRDKPNQKQMEYLNTQLLVKIKESKLYECVILGGNLNGFQHKFPEGYNFYPKLSTQITTFKKRTKTQAQIAKNNLRDKRSLDKIITNREILECEITLIDGTKPDLCSDEELRKQNDKSKQLIEQKDKCGEGLNSKIKMMLPCEIHPFDKFLVKTTIQVPNYQQSDSLSQLEVK